MVVFIFWESLFFSRLAYMFPHLKFSESEIGSRIENASRAEVEKILAQNDRLSYFDFLTLLSPAAGESLSQMTERATVHRRCHFGKTVRFYLPLYISNYCCNECVYCGFRASNHEEIRRRITPEEILEETRIIKSYGIDSLLIVSGEDPRAVNVPFLESILPELRKQFDSISIEIQPLQEADYRRLVNAGVHGLCLYQETYDATRYAELHRRGPKKFYAQRLEHMKYGAKAGFHQLGIGALLGLYPWRLEAASVAAHGLWLMKNYWRSKVNFSFPRITPAGSFVVPHELSEADLEQMILAFRIFFPENDITLSTRESAPFRDRLAVSAVTSLSAGSKVSPGAYAACENEDLPQFTMNDNRSTAEMVDTYRRMGFEIVYKDWDPALDVLPGRVI